MRLPRAPKATVGFVDQYCPYYRALFADVRSFEQFTALHVGLMAELPRKTLPAIARAVGLDDAQPFPHFLTHSPWRASALREKRLKWLQHALQGCQDNACDIQHGPRVIVS